MKCPKCKQPVDTLRQFVAVLIDGRIITTDKKQMVEAAKNGSGRLISRAELEFMAAADLGPQWNKLARAPVAFVYCKCEKPR